MKNNNTQSPALSTLYIPLFLWQRLMAYVKAVDVEISGLGEIELIRAARNAFLLRELHLPRQVSGLVETELDTESLSMMMIDMIEKGADVAALKLWWHSHGKGSVGWSSTDETTIQGFSNGWMLSLVLNHQEDFRCRLDIYDPIHVTVANVELEILFPQDEAMLEEVAAEVASQVSIKVEKLSWKERFEQAELPLRPRKKARRTGKNSSQVDAL